jgi:DNA-binding MarR family transcriptional regulator
LGARSSITRDATQLKRRPRVSASRRVPKAWLPAETARHLAAFRAALRSFLRETEKSARASGLTPQRYLLLLMIKGAPDGTERATVTALAERMELAQSTVTELVQRAEDAGLIERERSDVDGRVDHLHLSSEGERRLARAVLVSQEDRRQLRRMLEELEQAEAQINL